MNNIVKCLNEILTGKQKALGLLVASMSVISAMLQVFSISLFIPFIGLMMNTGSEKDTAYIGSTLSILQDLNIRNPLLIIALIIWGIFIVKNYFEIINNKVRISYSQMVRKEFAIIIMRYYLYGDYENLVTAGKARVIKELQQDTSGINSVIYSIHRIIAELFTVAGILVFIAVTDFRMMLIILLAAVLYLIIVFKYYRRRMRLEGLKLSKSVVRYNQSVLNVVEGYKEIRVLGKQDFFLNDFDRALNDEMKSEKIIETAAVNPAYVAEMMLVSFFIVYVILVFMGGENYLKMIPLLASFAAGSVRMLPSLGRIAAGLNNITSCLPQLHNAYRISKQISRDRAEQGEVKEANAIIIKDDFLSEIELNQVSWSYSEPNRLVLDKVSLVINKGSAIGIIGESGAGKSTLVDILLGIYSPQKGSVLVDGIDLRNMYNSWSKLVGFVSQDIYISNSSIKSNIAFGVPEEEIDELLIWETLKLARLDDHVRALPNKLDTLTGDRGEFLSGGQRQRIAIARALYRRPKVLFLDEATSSLDTETEYAIMEAIEALYGRMTIVIIAHRISTVRNCDKVYAVKEGKVIEYDKDLLKV